MDNVLSILLHFLLETLTSEAGKLNQAQDLDKVRIGEGKQGSMEVGLLEAGKGEGVQPHRS